MNKDKINIGIVSKGRLKNFTENLLRKRKLKIFSERGERDLFGKIKGKSNIRVLFLHAREIIEQLSIGNLDIGISGYDLLKESEINIQKKINLILGNICCHKSIRSGRILNLDEMNALLREMEVTPNSGQCNHGRPTSIALSVKQIEKLFERI